ncbi:hypothetical protein HN014_04200 [Aquimarina sp. TRL1]|uniref:hypothetical protein n=1 Tax=Aquimarina sp. (strain TRL1) TaxID=2736252 RepID=UPI00158AFFA8|nr:hypothetical protein [Aquimarina sp. TRL1]QKX04140.1 hypothetical protein HN014_04200 [Aquimarina sp. TRL1]
MDVIAETIEQAFTDAGEIPLGFLFASVKNIGDSEVMVNNLPLAPGDAKSYPFVGKPHDAKSFDPMDSTLYVMYIT